MKGVPGCIRPALDALHGLLDVFVYAIVPGRLSYSEIATIVVPSGFRCLPARLVVTLVFPWMDASLGDVDFDHGGNRPTPVATPIEISRSPDGVP